VLAGSVIYLIGLVAHAVIARPARVARVDR
jgi:hypothetical protein